MNDKSLNSKRYIILIGLLVLIVYSGCIKRTPTVREEKQETKEIKEEAIEAPTDYFASLEHRLIADGYDAAVITSLYKKPEVAFEWKGVALFFKHSEAKLDYSQFLNAQSIESAKTYMREHYAELSNAQQTYGVKKEIITAIILVETRLGTFLGTKSVLNILSTMAALEDPAIRDILWKQFSDSSIRTREEFQKWSERKSQWAYEELKCFLTYTKAEKLDPASILGSYAGALGIAQFMPSNILKLGQDGDRNGHIDLFNHSDAIASIANYLKYYGWHPGIDDDAASKVLYQYNHSPYYVNTLLTIARKLSA